MVALGVLASGLLTRRALAAGGGSMDAYTGIAPGSALDVHAMTDGYSQWRVDAPAAGAVAYRAFDVNGDGPSLGFARLTVAHAPDSFGFRADVGAGDLANAYYRSDPASFSDPAVARAFSYVEQAFVSALVPWGRGLEVDVGKFGTPVGLEDNEAIENWNYSRSLLFLLAEPSYHSGLRVTLQATETLAVSAFWLNGWDSNALGGNGMRSYALAATWTPAERTSVSLVYAGGLERAPQRLSDPSLTFRNVWSTFATYELDEHVSFAATFDYGIDAYGGGATFWGAGGYVRVQAPSWLAFTARGEKYEDPDGFTTGIAQRIAEATLTVEARTPVGKGVVLGRLEYRRDQSDEHVFPTTTGPATTHQDTITVAAIAAY